MDFNQYLTEIKKDKFCGDIRDSIVEAFEKMIQEISQAGGVPGRGIASFLKTNSNGLIDTYTITYTDGTKDTLTITNGGDGQSDTNLNVTFDEETGDLSIKSITGGGESSEDINSIWEGEY